MVATLVDIYRRETLTFLQYVRQACPYISPIDRELANRVVAMADSEQRAIAELGEAIDHRREPLPHVGAFPSDFTYFNFIAIRKLLPRLVADQRQQVAHLERDLAQLPEADRAVLAKLLQLKQAHLTELEKLSLNL